MTEPTDDYINALAAAHQRQQHRRRVDDMTTEIIAIYATDLPRLMALTAEAAAANDRGHALEAQARAARAAGQHDLADDLREQADAAYARDAACCRQLYEYTVPAIEYSRLGGMAEYHARRAAIHARCAATLEEARRRFQRPVGA